MQWEISSRYEFPIHAVWCWIQKKIITKVYWRVSETWREKRVTKIDRQMKREGTIQWAEQIFVTLQSLVLETQFPLLRLNKTFLNVFTGFIWTLKTSYFLYFHVEELKKWQVCRSSGWLDGIFKVGHPAATNSSLLASDRSKMSDDAPSLGHRRDVGIP